MHPEQGTAIANDVGLTQPIMDEAWATGHPWANHGQAVKWHQTHSSTILAFSGGEFSIEMFFQGWMEHEG